MEIAALVSGGVDSSVIVPLLKELGYNPHIFYIKIGIEGREDISDCPSEEDMEITTFIAKKYGCSFDVVDLQKEYFDNVARYTMESVKKGLTPNPDVMCNRMIKFGAFNDKMGFQFDRIATGHYACSWEDENGVSWLGTATDALKDQTDFLSRPALRVRPGRAAHISPGLSQEPALQARDSPATGRSPRTGSSSKAFLLAYPPPRPVGRIGCRNTPSASGSSRAPGGKSASRRRAKAGAACLLRRYMVCSSSRHSSGFLR